MSYSYVMDGLPAMFKSGSNSWSVIPVTPALSKIHIDTDMEIKPIAAFFMGWILKPKLLKGLDEMLIELKYFIENGSVHPRKQKGLKRSRL